MNNDLISRSELKKAIENYLAKRQDVIIWETDMFNMLDNAPTVEPEKKLFAEIHFDEEQLQELVDKAKAEVLASIERPQGEWVRKEDIIHYIATQYSEHNELVPIWLSIGDLKGGTNE